jgi:membrane protease YdiL (CAAX protease family)
MTGSFGWPGITFPPSGLVAALMPGIAAIAVSAWVGGRRMVGELLRQVGVWRVSPRWYAAAVLVIPAIVAVSWVASSAFRGAWLPSPEVTVGAVAVMILIQIPNTLAEEIGWRGFALPRLAQRYGWFLASIVLGVIWAIWHLPYWISAPNVHLYGVMAIVLFLVMPVAVSMFFAWMYRATRSVLLTWLAHLSTNVAIAFMPLSSESIGSLWPQALYTTLILALGVVSAIKLLAPAGAPTLRVVGRPSVTQ